MNNFKLPLALFLGSLIVTIVGTMLKMQQLPGGPIIVQVLIFVQAFALAWLVFVLLKRPVKKP